MRGGVKRLTVQHGAKPNDVLWSWDPSLTTTVQPIARPFMLGVIYCAHRWVKGSTFMVHVPKFSTSFQSRRSPAWVGRVALVSHTIVMTEEFATSMGSLEGFPSDATDLSILAKKWPWLNLFLKKHGTVDHFRLPIKKGKFKVAAASQGVVMWELLLNYLVRVERGPHDCIFFLPICSASCYFI